LTYCGTNFPVSDQNVLGTKEKVESCVFVDIQQPKLDQTYDLVLRNNLRTLRIPIASEQEQTVHENRAGNPSGEVFLGLKMADQEGVTTASYGRYSTLHIL
jgi:hypothetical protein